MEKSREQLLIENEHLRQRLTALTLVLDALVEISRREHDIEPDFHSQVMELLKIYISMNEEEED